MPDQPESDDNKDEEREWREREEPDDWFSQEDDDLAGRSWHGMNSDAEEAGRFESDDDTEDEDARKQRSS